MTQIMGLKSCLHNLINLQLPPNGGQCAVPCSYHGAPPRPATRTQLCSPQRDALPFTPFPPKSRLSLPDACCWDEHALAAVISKQAQAGGERLTVCLGPYATWQQSLSDMAGVWATARGSLPFNLFYSPLPPTCLCLQWKGGIKSASGPHQTGFIVWLRPRRETTLIILRAVFQTGLTAGLGSALIAAIFCHQLMTDLMRQENARRERR